MAVKMIQVTLSGATQVSSSSKKARWIAFANNAAAAMKLADSGVSASHGIPLAAGATYTAQPKGDPSLVYDLSEWYAQGTDTQVLDVIYDSVA